MDLFDLLACPTCKSALRREPDSLMCEQCRRCYPIINGTPVLLPDGSVPATSYQDDLDVRTGYDPWIHRIVLQSLPQRSIVLDIGAGNMALDLANVIRMDVTLTPYVDVVGDAHALPFLPQTFDFIFSLAVIEHLRNPYLAAQEAYTALRSGGYVYGECNFVYPYHGYPYHFFNATQQGLEAAFRDFRKLRSGVAPYQMPSFALRAVLETYGRNASNGHDPHFIRLKRALGCILEHPLGTYDQYFSEQAALRLAAGTYFFGVKLDEERSEVIPRQIQEMWSQTPALQAQFPDMLDLGTAKNVLQWAIGEAEAGDPAAASALAVDTAFRKHESAGPGTEILRDLPLIEPEYSHIPEPERERTTAAQFDDYDARLTSLTRQIEQKNAHIHDLEQLISRIERGRVLSTVRWLQGLTSKLAGK